MGARRQPPTPSRLGPATTRGAAVVVLTAVVMAQPMPELLGRGVISSEHPEFAFTATPDGREIFFNRASPDRTTLTILTSHRTPDGHWSAPAVAPFSGTYRDLDPFITPDGQRLFFTSDRPRAGGTRVNAIWVATRTTTGWSAPVEVGPPLNSGAGEVYVTQARDGTTVFSSNRDGAPGVYLSREVDGRWSEPVRLSFGGVVDAGNPAIAPSGRFLVAVRTPAGGSPDLFVSCRTADGWSALRPLTRVNSASADFAPSIDAAETALTFTSERPGVAPAPPAGQRPPGDLYRIGLEAAGVRCP